MADYNLGTASGRIVVDGRGAQVGFQVAQTAASAFFDVVKLRVDDVQRLGKRMAAVGAGGVAGFGVAVKVASSFEKQMSGVYAVANANEDQMEKLRKKALQLGKDTQYSASEAASALEEIIKAGISVEDALNGGADAAVALAAAGGISLPEAATIAANAMNSFEISAKDLPKIADVLAGVANTSAADVSDLGQSFQQASAVAHLAGLSFRDTAIAIGEMADNGIKGSDAGTSLKTMLNNLIPTTDTQIGKFKELGLLTFNLAGANKALAHENLPLAKTFDEAQGRLEKYMKEMGKGNVGTLRNRKAVMDLLQQYGGMHNAFFTAQGDVKNLRGLQGTLAKALKGMTREQKLSTLETLFGADAMRASAILSLDGAKGYDKFSAAVSKTKAADVAKTRMDNLSGGVEKFKGSLETVQIIIGSVFLPAITKLVAAATKVLDMFISLPEPIQKTIAILALIASSGLLLVGVFLAMLPVIASFLVHMLALRAIKAVLGSFKIFFTTLRAGQGIMAATQAGFVRMGASASFAAKRALFMARAVKIVRAAFLLMTGPIGIAIAVVAALIALGVLLYNKYKPFHDLVNKIGSAIKDKLQAAWKSLQPVLIAAGAALIRVGQFIAKNLLPVLIQVGQYLLGKVVKAFNEVWNAIQGDLMPAVNDLGKVFTGTLLPALAGIWSAAKPVIDAFFQLAGIVLPILAKILVVIAGIFIKYVLPILIKIAAFLVGVLIDAIKTFIVGCIKVVTGVIQIFTGLINFFKGLFTGNWSQMWHGLLSIVKGAWNLIVGAVKIFMSIGIIKAVGLGFRLLWAIVRGGWRVVLAIFRGAGGGIWAAVRGIFRFVVNFVKGGMRNAVALIRGGWNLAVRLIRGAQNAALGIVRTLARGIVTLIKGGIRNFTSNVRAGFRFVVSIVRSAFSNFVGAVRSGIGRAVAFVRGLPGKVKGALRGIGGLLKGLGSDLMSGFISGVKAMASRVADAVLAPIRAAKSAVKGLLKSNSPSKVYMQIGKDTMLGYAIGAEKEGDKSKRSVVDMAQMMVDGFASVTKNFDPVLVASLDRTTVTAKAALKTTNTGAPSTSGGLGAILEALRQMQINGTLRIDPSLLLAVMEAVAEDAVEGNNMTQRRDARMNAGV